MASRQPRAVTPRARNGFQIASAGITGVAIFGTLGATGLVAGEAAAGYHADQAHRQARADSAAAEVEAARIAAIPKYVVVGKNRPRRTVVKTTVIDRIASPAVAQPGAGGTVTTRPSGGGSGGAGSTSAPTASHPKSPPKSPPKPPPAPSSGS